MAEVGKKARTGLKSRKAPEPPSNGWHKGLKCKAKSSRTGKPCGRYCRQGFLVCPSHGAGTRKRVQNGTRKDPVQAGVDAGLGNIRTGRYVRSLERWPELQAKLQTEIAEGKAEGATFDAELGLLRHCLENLIATMGTNDVIGLEVIRDQIAEIIKASTAKARAEQGLKIDLTGGVLPMLERIGDMVRDGVRRLVKDENDRRALETYLDAGFARCLSECVGPGLAAVGGIVKSD